MKARDLINLGVPDKALRAAIVAVAEAGKSGMDKKEMKQRVIDLIDDPAAFEEDAVWGNLAIEVIAAEKKPDPFVERDEPAPYRQWGEDLEAGAIKQMDNACRLPVSVAGALMPDAHQGYGLPIGGVLAVENAVIPYAVGVDIACRMKLTVLDLPANAISGQSDKLKHALENETRFGMGAKFRDKRDHDVLDDDWKVTKLTSGLKDLAWSQLGTSGTGNHFVEFGVLKFEQPDLDLNRGEYLALLSHSGSRGAGAQVANHYSKLAMEMHPELPKELKHLAWLSLDEWAGIEYWKAMQLMGKYAAANHDVIHKSIAKTLGAKVLLDVENHHNFAWKEMHHGKQVIVHRKGATPADEGTLGIIPGSMGTPGFLVRGKGFPDSLNSASHGAGRIMSRKKALQQFTWSDTKKFLKHKGITLLSAGLDEVPMAYKDIHQVMAAQTELVDTIAQFEPKIVKMADEEESQPRRGRKGK